MFKIVILKQKKELLPFFVGLPLLFLFPFLLFSHDWVNENSFDDDIRNQRHDGSVEHGAWHWFLAEVDGNDERVTRSHKSATGVIIQRI